jgi:hypothetical protein
MLKKYYGEMIIKEGSILYHTSDDEFKYKNINIKPVLFCTFHPSEWTGDNKLLHFIKIKRDVNLLFMIDYINDIKIYTSYEKIIKNKEKNNDNNLKLIANELKKENFDGWFGSIDNKAFVEVVLINNLEIFEFIETRQLKKNWKDGNYLNNAISLKDWGNMYNICCIKNPVILNINNKYKKIIEKYKDYEIKSRFQLEYIFQLILENAIINFFN